MNQNQWNKVKKNFDDARIDKIKKDFKKLRDRLSKPKIKDVWKDLYKIEYKKKKVDWKNLFKLEKCLSKLKKNIMIMMILNTKE